MEAVITRVALRAGAEDEWASVMRDRMTAAESADGWVAGYVLDPADDKRSRVIVGVWETRDGWKAWHEAPAFKESADRLAELETESGSPTWHAVLHAGGASAAG